MSARWKNAAASGALCAVATMAWGQEETLAVPSGMAITLLEVREEAQADGTVWLRFRYVAPGITRDEYDEIQGDFEALCQGAAVNYRPATGMQVSQAVISIASEPVDFGATAPNVSQFFEAFRLEDGACIWEAF